MVLHVVLHGGHVHVDRHGSAVHGHDAHVIHGVIQASRESTNDDFLEAVELDHRPEESQAWETPRKGHPQQAAAVVAVGEEKSHGAEGEVAAAAAPLVREGVLEEEDEARGKDRGGREDLAGVHRTGAPHRTARRGCAIGQTMGVQR